MKNLKSIIYNLKSISLLAFCLLLAACCLLPSTILAQDATPSAAPKALPSTSILTAIPPHVNISIKPGETIQETLKVKNDSDAEILLEALTQDFIVTDDKGTPIPLSDDENKDNRWSLQGWISLSPSAFIIRPGEIQLVSMTVSVPADALPGGHYAMVTYSPSSEGMLGATGSRISQKVCSLINVVVAGDIKEDASVIRFLPSTRFAEYGPIDFTSEIKNLSDTHIAPTGIISVSNMLNKEIQLLQLGKVNIFPYTSRIYQNSFSGKWHLGRYKAELKAAYGDKGKLLNAVVYFWIIPWKLILAVLMALILLTTLVLFIRKQGKKKADKLVQEKVEEMLKKETGNR